jgi:pyridinium-3,5-bisthiocarboxylic acid mononucleotide nickel chelatase
VRIAYFDCFNGAAGDMIVGGLIDAGVSVEELGAVLSSLGVRGLRVRAERVVKQGFAATQFVVEDVEGGDQGHRHLSDVNRIIEGAGVSVAVRDRAKAVFLRLGRAEAAVHGCEVETVHFHEVGAVDAIADIVGACWAIERLGVDRVVCSTIPLGSGTVRCEHGLMPVPAPATAKLVTGLPVVGTDEPGELTTPTGAAIIGELAVGFGPMPEMRVESVGVGAGTRDGVTRPNIFRVLIGEGCAGGAESSERDSVSVLEANIDDGTGESVGYAIERVLKAGALDAFCVPIQMKKTRPGVLLTVICEPGRVSEMEMIVFAETTTFGIRRHLSDRTKLNRRVETVETPYGSVRVKIGSVGDRAVTVSAEYEDCRRIAEENGIALRALMEMATETWRRGTSS